MKTSLANIAKLIWRTIPVSPAARGKLAGFLFSTFPWLFHRLEVYQTWKEQNDRQAERANARNIMTHRERIGADDGLSHLRAFAPPSDPSARAIAFYLPQFHPIPENNAWWGEGFTEWTNVRPAEPQFDGHYQPHIPAELGYYDLLNDDEILARQCELAALHGIEGFCFYFYWFAGKRLLEDPIKKYAGTPQHDRGFCLCWANENWSRRWDGRDDDILIAQDHSAEDDLAFIEHISAYMRDDRYIRINGRPVLLVYRPALLPDAKETADRWRHWCRDNGIGEIYLAYTQSFEIVDPDTYGFDAAIEFPPNNSGLEHDRHLVIGLNESFDGQIYDWRRLAESAENYVAPAYKLFRGVTPSWDNTPRRGTNAGILVNASPAAYEQWLSSAVRETHTRIPSSQERLVFINAWNEWAEGAHLEPDERYGYAWLEATRQALCPSTAATRPKIIIAIHDLHRHGAQFLAANLAKTLQTQFNAEIAILTGEDGMLSDTMREYGTVTIIDFENPDLDRIEMAIASLKSAGFDKAIINSAAAGMCAKHLAANGIQMLGLIHEMASVIERMSLQENIRDLDEHAKALVFASDIVRDQSAAASDIATFKNALIRPQGLDNHCGIATLTDKAVAKEKIARQFGFDQQSKIVLAVAYGDHRKGVDIFVNWAIAAIKKYGDAQFIWIGEIEPAIRQTVTALIDDSDAANNVHFLGFTDKLADYYQAADAYALTSREDPFPSTALEALSAGTPVYMVRGTSGIETLRNNASVTVLENTNGTAFADALGTLFQATPEAAKASMQGVNLIREEFGFASYTGDLLDLLETDTPNVSVVVPNFNYAPHLEKRLTSILQQTLAPREVIIIDDGSTDNSISVIEETMKHANINWRLIRNTENSGSPFPQWQRGVNEAKGDIVWIAEADDWADPQFLDIVSRRFGDPDIAMAYCQSKPVDTDGTVIDENYLFYTEDISISRWARNYIAEGNDEISDGLSIKNTIPNVSAALFRREALTNVLNKEFEDIISYRAAGDWRAYAGVLATGKIAFHSQPLNFHRRHDQSVTIRQFDLRDLNDIARMQGYITENYAVSAATHEKSAAYLQALAEQFSLHQRYTSDEIARASTNTPLNI